MDYDISIVGKKESIRLQQSIILPLTPEQKKVSDIADEIFHFSIVNQSPPLTTHSIYKGEL